MKRIYFKRWSTNSTSPSAKPAIKWWAFPFVRHPWSWLFEGFSLTNRYMTRPEFDQPSFVSPQISMQDSDSVSHAQLSPMAWKIIQPRRQSFRGLTVGSFGVLTCFVIMRFYQRQIGTWNIGFKPFAWSFQTEPLTDITSFFIQARTFSWSPTEIQRFLHNLLFNLSIECWLQQ